MRGYIDRALKANARRTMVPQTRDQNSLADVKAARNMAARVTRASIVFSVSFGNGLFLRDRRITFVITQHEKTDIF